MDIFKAVILGIVQGITEFLPVSSSGHLVLFQKMFQMAEPPIFFDALLHFGTLIAVVFYLRKDIISIFKEKDKKMMGLIVLGCIPAVIAGLMLKDKIGEIFNSLTLVAVSFIITSMILFATYFFKPKEKPISWLDSIFIGIFQAISIIPGISRSGSTISAGLYRNLTREKAFKFSFLMAIPILLGAFLLQVKEAGLNFDGNPLAEILGFLMAIIFGLLALRILERVMIRGKFYLFAIYCLILGMTILVFF